MSPDARHEFFMQLASEPYAERQFLQPGNSVLKSNHIVADLPKIVGTSVNGRPRLGGQQLPQRSLRPFNLAR